MYKSVVVFCGSKDGRDPLYLQHATTLGSLLAQQGITLIYGGGNNGLMGAVANAVLEQKGKVIGVIPELFNGREVKHETLTELHVVADMHVRKKMMYELAEAAIILPGGAGTMDELFEIITWNNLTIHDKKIVMLNTAGYYNSLISHIVQMQKQGFLYEDWRTMIEIYDTPGAIINAWALNKN